MGSSWLLACKIVTAVPERLDLNGLSLIIGSTLVLSYEDEVDKILKKSSPHDDSEGRYLWPIVIWYNKLMLGLVVVNHWVCACYVPIMVFRVASTAQHTYVYHLHVI